MSDFASRIRECRKLSGLTQQEVAGNTGLSCRTIQQYEAGLRTPTFDGFLSLAQYFEVSLDYLAGLSNDPVRR